MFSAPRLGDRAFFNDFHRRCNRAGTNQERNVTGLARGHATADLEVAAQFTLDDWCCDHFRLALSISTIAMRLPMFWPVTSRSARAP